MKRHYTHIHFGRGGEIKINYYCGVWKGKDLFNNFFSNFLAFVINQVKISFLFFLFLS